tara:strand:- start:2028 stop:2516 length:489 start_codon:yes stop_codon:yes gene_type:complete
MAAGTWRVFGVAKRRMGTAGLQLSSGTFKMALHTTTASANLSIGRSVGPAGAPGITIWSSIGNEIGVSSGRYAVGGVACGGVKWSVAANTSTMKFYYTTTGVIITASAGSMTNVRYAVIRTSTGATDGVPICYASLSTAQFTVTSPNTLTILPAGTGVFTLG